MIKRTRASSIVAGAVGEALEPQEAFRLLKELCAGAIVVAPCVSCGKETKIHPELAGEPECLCIGCAADARALRESEQVDVTTSRVNASQFIQGNLQRCGLEDTKRIRDALAISVDVPRGKLEARGRFAIAAQAVLDYLGAASKPGTMILGGPSGCGKSTAAAFAVWATQGRFLQRATWRNTPVRGKGGDAEVKWLGAAPGVLVIDDCLAITKSGDPGDSDWETEVVWSVLQVRHEAHRPTILTTQAVDAEIRVAYGTKGDAILRRAAAGAQDLEGKLVSGGYRWCGGARG